MTTQIDLELVPMSHVVCLGFRRDVGIVQETCPSPLATRAVSGVLQGLLCQIRLVSVVFVVYMYKSSLTGTSVGQSYRTCAFLYSALTADWPLYESMCIATLVSCSSNPYRYAACDRIIFTCRQKSPEPSSPAQVYHLAWLNQLLPQRSTGPMFHLSQRP